jgi:hypothetical protein
MPAETAAPARRWSYVTNRVQPARGRAAAPGLGAHEGRAWLRLLLDEKYPSAVAERLRARGHDVVAVTERPELRSLTDPDVFMVSQRERRAVVTENVADFVEIADRLDERGQPHFGLVLIDPANYRRGHPRTIGRMVTQLDQLLRDHPDDRPTSLAPLAVDGGRLTCPQVVLRYVPTS